MSIPRAAAIRIALLGAIALSACGDDKAPGASGDLDDADVIEVDASDAGADAEAPDADAEADPDSGDLSQCEGDVLEFDVANGVGRPFSAAISSNRVHLVYTVPSAGGTLSNPTSQGLAYTSFGTSGAAEPATFVNVGVEVYSKTRDPALVARGAEVDLFFTSNLEDSYELYYKNLGANAAPVRLTTNQRNELNLTAASFGDGSVTIYSDEPGMQSAAGAVAMTHASGQPPLQLIGETAGIHAAQLAFAEVGSAGQGALGFVGDLEQTRGLYLQTVSSDGQPAGDLVKLTDKLGGASSIDVAKGAEGGAVVYTEAERDSSIHQLRFRQLNADAQVSERVRMLTTGTQNLGEVTLARYSDGYAIAYRRLAGESGAGAAIYLMFVDAQGNFSGTRLVRPASGSGKGIELLVGNDGRLVVLWSDSVSVLNPTTNRSETQLKLRAARLTCVVTKP